MSYVRRTMASALFVHRRTLAQWWPLAVIVVAAACLYGFGAQRVLSVDVLRSRQADLQHLVTVHPWLAVLVFVATTAIYLALSLPAEGLLTAVGGLLFGTISGTALSVAGAVGAALLLFFALRRLLNRQLAVPRGPAFERVREQMQRDGVSYLLMLRLLPVFPFALVSLLAVLVGMRAWPYSLATAIGVIPPTVVFASVGSGLGTLLAEHQQVDLADLLSGRILFPLVGLAVLALLPVAGRHWRSRAAKKAHPGPG